MPAIQGEASKTCTHVLEYIPWWLFDGPKGSFFWDLQTRANFEAGTPEDAHDLPKPADVADPTPWLTEQVGAQLGHPVILTAACQEIKRRRYGRWHTVPVFYVSPR
jgi:hypothetical protein